MHPRRPKEKNVTNQSLTPELGTEGAMSPGLTRPFSALGVKSNEVSFKRLKVEASLPSSHTLISQALVSDISKLSIKGAIDPSSPIKSNIDLKQLFDLGVDTKLKDFIFQNFESYLEQGYENYLYLLNQYSDHGFIQLATIMMNTDGETATPIELRATSGNPFLDFPKDLIAQLEKFLPTAMVRAARDVASPIPPDVGAMRLDASRLFVKMKTDEKTGKPLKDANDQPIFQFYTIPVKQLMFISTNLYLPKPELAEAGCWNFVLLSDIEPQPDGIPRFEFVIRRGVKGGHKFITPLREKVAIVAGEMYFDADGQLKLICPRSQYFHLRLTEHYAMLANLKDINPALHALCVKYLGENPSQFNAGQEALLQAVFTRQSMEGVNAKKVCVLPEGVNYHYTGNEVEFTRRLNMAGVGEFIPEYARKKAEDLLNAKPEALATSTSSSSASMFSGADGSKGDELAVLRIEKKPSPRA